MVKKTDSGNGNVIFRPKGEMNIYTAQENTDLLLQVMSGCESIAVDLSRVTVIDTAGIQILLLAYVEAGRRGVSIKFRGHSEPVVEALKLCKLSHLFGEKPRNRTNKGRRIAS